MSGREVPGKKCVSPENLCCAQQENLDLFCHPCVDDDQHVEAHGFCVDCWEYLCRDCIQYHKKVRATKKHVIQDKQAMPKDANMALQLKQPNDNCTETCTKHHGKIIEYFCEAHDELVCNVCVTLGHITCGVRYIPEISKGTSNSEEYIHFLKEIDDQQHIFEKTEVKSKEIIHATEIESQTYTNKVIQFGDDVINHIKYLVQEAIDEKDKIVRDIIDGLKSSLDQSVTISQEINSMKADLESKKYSDSLSFVLMKRIQLKIKENAGTLSQTLINSKPTVFQFVENRDLKPMKGIQFLGTFQRYKRVVKWIEDIRIPTQKGDEMPRIRGIEVLSDGRLAMIDIRNYLVKLMDLNDNTVKEIKLDSEPSDLSVVSDRQLVVTLYARPEIQFLNVSDKLSLGRNIRTGEPCFGIAACQAKLIVGFLGKPGYVKIMCMTGQLLRKITTGQNGEQLFSFPHSIAIKIYSNMFYVSDYKTKTVTCLTLKGEVRAIYSDDSLGPPFGMAIDEDGSVYICGLNGVIQRVSAECTKIQTLLEESQAGAASYCIAYDTDNRKMYLAGMSDCVHVYQLG